jgi:ketosteroid isomerase-like protein
LLSATAYCVFGAIDRLTKKGEAYNNNYCIVYRLENGTITHLTEYADLTLSERVLPELDLTEGV